MPVQDISPQAARHVLFEFGYGGGDRPGGFTTALIRAASLADSLNLDRLEHAFPSLIGAYRVAAKELDGVERLHAIAGIIPDKQKDGAA